MRKRAAFLDHHFWATRFRDAEMHASGYYPNQSTGGDGLERWTADDESLDKSDVVVWSRPASRTSPAPRSGRS